MAKKSIIFHNPIEIHFEKISKYHIYIFLVVFFCNIPLTWNILGLIFLSPHINFRCESQNRAVNYCPCKLSSVIWDKSTFNNTIEMKYGIYCEKKWLTSFSQSMYYGGLLVGAAVFGYLADRYGRLLMMSLSCVILGLFGAIAIVAPQIPQFIVVRFIQGIGNGGVIVTAFVYTIEHCNVKHREVMTALYHIPINLGHISLPGISYLLRDSDDYELAISLVMVVFGFAKYFLMESPKWLLDIGDVDESATVMKKICKINKTSSDDIEKELHEFHSQQRKKGYCRESVFRIFQHKTLCLRLCCMGFIYFSCGFGFYGLSQFIGHMNDNVHLNVAISGVLTLPGTILSIFLLPLIGRKTLLISSSLLSGIFLIIVVCLPESTWLRVIFACISNCFFFLSFIVIFLYGVELFPTTIRNSAVGILSVLSRIGQMCSPPVNTLPELWSGILYSSMPLIGAVLCLFLPETKDTELPSSFDEAEEIDKNRETSENAGTSKNIFKFGSKHKPDQETKSSDMNEV